MTVTTLSRRRPGAYRVVPIEGWVGLTKIFDVQARITHVYLARWSTSGNFLQDLAHWTSDELGNSNTLAPSPVSDPVFSGFVWGNTVNFVRATVGGELLLNPAPRGPDTLLPAPPIYRDGGFWWLELAGDNLVGVTYRLFRSELDFSAPVEISNHITPPTELRPTTTQVTLRTTLSVWATGHHYCALLDWWQTDSQGNETNDSAARNIRLVALPFDPAAQAGSDLFVATATFGTVGAEVPWRYQPCGFESSAVHGARPHPDDPSQAIAGLSLLRDPEAAVSAIDHLGVVSNFWAGHTLTQTCADLSYTRAVSGPASSPRAYVVHLQDGGPVIASAEMRLGPNTAGVQIDPHPITGQPPSHLWELG